LPIQRKIPYDGFKKVSDKKGNFEAYIESYCIALKTHINIQNYTKRKQQENLLEKNEDHVTS
jgi:hypothetical protein